MNDYSNDPTIEENLVQDIDRLKPRDLDEYIGQRRIKEQVMIMMLAAKKRDDIMNHCLLEGPPGHGKTQLVELVAAEMGVPFIPIACPSIKVAQDVVDIFMQIAQGSMVLLDEVHRLAPKVEEILYPILQDGKIMNKDSTYTIGRITAWGTTTEAQKLSGPLRDRFINKFSFAPYKIKELMEIVANSAQRLSVRKITNKALRAIAEASRETPRHANGFLLWARDYMDATDSDEINEKLVLKSLHIKGIDRMGLDNDDRTLLRMLAKRDGKPLGLEVIAQRLNRPPETIKDLMEPHLNRLGFLERVSKGRVITREGKIHLKRYKKGLV